MACAHLRGEGSQHVMTKATRSQTNNCVGWPCLARRSEEEGVRLPLPLHWHHRREGQNPRLLPHYIPGTKTEMSNPSTIIPHGAALI